MFSVILLTCVCILQTSSVRANSLPVNDENLNNQFGDPYQDCLTISTCANCVGTGGRAQFRTMDGSCNNLDKPTQGASQTKHKRYLSPEYLSGTTGYPRGFAPYSTMASPHTVARNVFQSVAELLGNEHQPQKTSILFMVFGQFIDHDAVATGHTPTSSCSATCAEDSLTEYIYPCNPLRKIETTTDVNKCTKLTRTKAACQNSENTDTNREQVNRISSYIDGSAIYGSSDEMMMSLRNEDISASTPNDGKLRIKNVGTGDLLPDDFNLPERCNDPGKAGCFAAGDSRNAEHIGLASMHTLWVREHNRIATELKTLNPLWSGSKIFFTARRIVVAEIQNILLNEWLPLVTDIDKYIGYDDTVDASIANVFAHSVFRFGHTLVPNTMPQKNFDFENLADRDHVPLREAFFNTRHIRDHGIESTMYGMMANQSEAFDTTFAEAIARFLFIPLGEGGLEDLSAINIHRGRDHGLPPYVKWREFCGLSEVTEWDDLEDDMSEQTILNLQKVYTNVGEIDIFVGGVSENSSPQKVVGPTFGCIIGKQFNDLFKGDRYFYTNYVFTLEQFSSIRNVKMRQVLCENLDDIVSLQEFPFTAYNEELDPSIRRRVCETVPYTDPQSEAVNLELWKDSPYP